MTKLTFLEKTAVYDSRTDNVLFQASDEDLNTVRCIIGAKPLQDHFGARGRSQQQLMAAFQRGIHDIEQVADRKYKVLGGGNIPELVLNSRDFDTDNTLERQLAKHLQVSSEDLRH
jgi:hypothetical protein